MQPVPSPNDLVVLVDEHDRPHGVAEKLRAHQEGWLHRAFSVCLFNSRGELLLQQRHPGKYHSGGLWSNTCCSHPRPDEPVSEAALRRLDEEMGMTAELRPAFSFVYRTAFADGLIEHEYDHVFVGRTDAVPQPCEAEVHDYRWIAPDALRADLEARPEAYSFWFRLLLDRLLAHPLD